MLDNDLYKYKYFFRQDTISVSKDGQDSSVFRPVKDLTEDTAKIILSGPGDSVPAERIEVQRKEFISKADSSQISIKKRPVSTGEIKLSESRDRNAGSKSGARLSWNKPENFAKEIFSPGAGTLTINHAYTGDTVTSFEETRQKGGTFYKRFQTNTDWIFWTYIIIVLLFVWIQVFYRKYITGLFNSGISYHVSYKLHSDKNAVSRRISVVLNFIYTISFSLLLFKFVQYLGVRSKAFNGFSLFLLVLNLVILFSLSKVILQKLIGFVFDRLELINEYLHHVYVFNKILGIILLPLSFAAFYTPENITEILLLATIVIYILSVLFKIIRGFQIIINHDIFILYTILYLCTLEILPIIIGYKILKSLA
jgi:hypothetical protein